jgi:hypothetical protein
MYLMKIQRLEVEWLGNVTGKADDIDGLSDISILKVVGVGF